MILKRMMKLLKEYLKRENRDNLYKKNNHISYATLSEHTFESISKDFFKLKPYNYNTQIKIYYSKYISHDCNCAILNCANADLPNAGKKIDRSSTQEGQLFNDSDIYATNIYDGDKCLYPFNFESELLYAKDVIFHNNKGEHWNNNSLRKNDMIIAAAKYLSSSKNTQKYAPTPKKIIESIFKIAAINNKKNNNVMADWMWSFSS